MSSSINERPATRRIFRIPVRHADAAASKARADAAIVSLTDTITNRGECREPDPIAAFGARLPTRTLGRTSTINVQFDEVGGRCKASAGCDWRSSHSAPARIATSIAMAAIAGCSGGVLDPAGPIGRDERAILLGSLTIMLTIVIPTIVGIALFAWWFRAGNRKAIYRPTWDFSPAIEIVVWSVPLMMIVLVGGVTWVSSHSLDPARPIDADKGIEPIEIQVVSLDWKWLFIYPASGVASLNDLVVPVGTPLRFRVTSASVFNSFFVPRLGSMIYAMNGMATTLHLQVDRPGTYEGLSAHFSGDGFSDMHFLVEAVSRGDFDGWIAKLGGHETLLDASEYRKLSEPESGASPRSFSNVQVGLFDKIVNRELLPAASPLSRENKGATARTSR